jgi:hypothetical protein
MIPSHNYGGHSITPSGNYRVRRSTGEEIPDESNFVPSLREELRYRVRDVLIYEQQHARTLVRHALRGFGLPILLELNGRHHVRSSQARILGQDCVSCVSRLMEMPDGSSRYAGSSKRPSIMDNIPIADDLSDLT